MTQPQYDAVDLLTLIKCDWKGEPTKEQLKWLYNEVDNLSFDEQEMFDDLLRVLTRNATFEVKI